MARLRGIVQLRERNGDLGSVVGGATVLIEPDGEGPGTSVVSAASGRYSVDVAPGDYRIAATHGTAGGSAAWARVVGLSDDEPRTRNLFLPSPEARLGDLVAAFPGEIAVYALNLQSGREVAINADCPMYLASITKVAVAAGCVDLMSGAAEPSESIRLELRHHRDEGKCIEYQDLGSTMSVERLLEWMISCSETTATDILCERYGVAEVNDRVQRLGIDGIFPFSSMILLDRRRWWLKDRHAAFLPEFAFSLYRRQRITAWLDELDLVPPEGQSDLSLSHVWVDENADESSDLWEFYLSERWELGTAAGYGELLERIARQSLLDAPWKNDILLNTVLAAGGEGRFSGVVGMGTIIGKGGGHKAVRSQAGIVRDASGTPVAVLAVFTQRVEFPKVNEANAFVRAAADLAAQALDVDADLFTPTPKSGEIVFLEPTPGQAFSPGDTPVIRWASKDVSGPLTLSFQGPGIDRTISTTVADDGEWHSFTLPDDLPASDIYRFVLVGTDADDDEVKAGSARFTVGGTLHVLRPSAGEALAPGTQPKIRWVSTGVEGPLRIDLLHDGRRIDTISRNARDDGEWHSWTVPDDLTAGLGYQIEISAMNDPAITDRSGPFEIGGAIEVLSPRPYDVLEIGTKPVIGWKTRDVVGPLGLALLGEDDEPLDIITTTARDDGEWHSWEVPDVPDGIGYRIEFTDRGAPGIVDYSPLFQIGTRFEWLSPSVEQATGLPWSPAARPHFFAYDQTAPLDWRRIGPEVGQLRIELLRDGAVVDTLTTNANDDGAWRSWTPTNDLPAASNYQFRISGRDRPSAFGLSVYFSIGAHIEAHIEASVVGRDLAVKPGDTPIVRWVTSVGGDVTLRLLDAAGGLVPILDRPFTAPASLGSARAPIPDADRGWHRIQVRAAEDPVFGHTEWFRIR